MAKYTLNTDGSILFTVRGGKTMHVYPEPGVAEWDAYQEWLAAGNVADPAPAPPVADANEDALKASDVQMIRAIDWVLEKLVEKNVITLAEIPQGLKDLYVQRKAQRGA